MNLSVITPFLQTIARLDNTRKFVYFGAAQAQATLLAYCHVLSGEHWVGASLTLAGLFAGANVMEHKSKTNGNHAEKPA